MATKSKRIPVVVLALFLASPALACKVGEPSGDMEAYIVSCSHNSTSAYSVDSYGRIVMDNAKVSKETAQAVANSGYTLLQSDEKKEICIENKWYKIDHVDSGHNIAILDGPIMNPFGGVNLSCGSDVEVDRHVGQSIFSNRFQNFPCPSDCEEAFSCHSDGTTEQPSGKPHMVCNDPQ